MYPTRDRLPRVSKATLHDALVRESMLPTIVTNGSGRIIEWNRATENVTAIPRSVAINQDISDVRAQLAPAQVPYEVAKELARDDFRDLVKQSHRGRGDWYRSFSEDFLSLDGSLHHLRSEVYPLWTNEELVVVSVLHEPDDHARHENDPNLSAWIDRLTRRIVSQRRVLYSRSAVANLFTETIRHWRKISSDRNVVCLDRVAADFLERIGRIAAERPIEKWISPFLVDSTRALELTLLIGELVFETVEPARIVVRPRGSTAICIEHSVPVIIGSDLVRRSDVRKLIDRLDGRISINRSDGTIIRIEFRGDVLRPATGDDA